MSRKVRRPLAASGLTLVEVLLALAILGLSGAILVGSLSTTLTSWSAGLVQGRRVQVTQIALERMMQQIKSSVPVVRIEEGRPVADFEAGEDHLRFVTLLPVGVRAPARVSYSIEETEEGKALVYREYLWPDKDLAESAEPVVEEFLPEIDELEVSIRELGELESTRAGPALFETRSMESARKKFPAEVTIRLRTAGGGEGDDSSLTITAPILVPEPQGGAPSPGRLVGFLL